MTASVVDSRSWSALAEVAEGRTVAVWGRTRSGFASVGFCDANPFFEVGAVGGG